MIGRLVGLVVRVLVVLAIFGWLGLGWMYRDRVVAAARVLRYGPDEAPAVGRASPAALGRAEEKLRALDSGRADSVVLGADEVAALVDRAIASRTGDAPESVAVILRHDQLEVSALVATAGFRNAIPGRARGLVRPTEQVEAALSGGSLDHRDGLGESGVVHVGQGEVAPLGSQLERETSPDA